MPKLNEIRDNDGARDKFKRIGRGIGSGKGKQGGRGGKGQKARAGVAIKGFEGGQMPLHRRLPKRGFTNIFRKQWIEVTLAALEDNFEAGDSITPEVMHERGVIAKGKRDIVVLGTGELTKALTVSAHRFTKGARKKIEEAGGTVNVITPFHKPDALVPVGE
jgi:large subunit ribosomal protein L15